MKALSIKLENYLLSLVNQEAKQNHTTKVEVIKTALLNFFIHREDMLDLQTIESRNVEKDIPLEEVFSSK